MTRIGDTDIDVCFRASVIWRCDVAFRVGPTRLASVLSGRSLIFSSKSEVVSDSFAQTQKEQWQKMRGDKSVNHYLIEGALAPLTVENARLNGELNIDPDDETRLRELFRTFIRPNVDRWNQTFRI